MVTWRCLGDTLPSHALTHLPICSESAPTGSGCQCLLWCSLHVWRVLRSSIGSNIFDILVGLPVPWLLKTGVVEPGTTAVIKATGLALNVIVLLFMVYPTHPSRHYACVWVLLVAAGMGIEL